MENKIEIRSKLFVKRNLLDFDLFPICKIVDENGMKVQESLECKAKKIHRTMR